MLTRVDRVQIVVASRQVVAQAYARLLGAVAVREDRVRLLGAWRTVLHLGTSEIELLEADGAGPTADFLARTGGGLFAAGFATPDLGRLRAHLEEQGVPVRSEVGQLFVSADALQIPGLHAVISPEIERPPVGLVRHLYEVTLLVNDAQAVTKRAAEQFGLEPAHFVPIHSAEYGYDGVLTLFHPERLDRIEIVTPDDATKTMGRFFAKRGPCLYMCYAEADELSPIRDALAAFAPHAWTAGGAHQQASSPVNLFVHPQALGGTMLGVSRTTLAWLWSGHPERVVSTAQG